MRHAFITLLFILIFQTIVSGQWRGSQMAHLGPAEGLPAQVFDMAQDSTGFLYFATNVGMYRYDGHDFSFYGHDPLDEHSIGAGDVYRIYAARDGLLWLTLRFGGLNSFNPVTGEFKKYPLPELPFRSVPGAQGIYEDNDDVLWVGGTHFRLFAFDRKSESYTTFSPEWIDAQQHGGRLTILSILPDSLHPTRLWLSVLDFKSEGSVSASYGIVAFDKVTHKFETFPCFGHTQYIDKGGVLWGSYWGNLITAFDPATTSCDIFRYDTVVNAVHVNGVSHDIEPYEGRLMLASSNALLGFDATGSYEVLTTIPSLDYSFQSLFADRDNNLWIGTSQGAFIIDPDDQHIRFFSLDQFDSPLRIFPGRLAYYHPDDMILLASPDNAPPYRIYKIPMNATHGASFISTYFPVEGIACDIHDRVWIAGDGHFYLFDPVSGHLTKTSLVEAAEPLPWLLNMKSNADGWVAGIGDEEFIWFHADQQIVRRIHMDQLPGSAFAKSYDNAFDGFSIGNADNAYLFSNEIFKVDLKTGVATVLKYDQKINPNLQLVQYVGDDQEGNIWIATVELVGKFRLVNDSLIIQDVFTIADGMISPAAVELHIDQVGRVWAFTTSGVNCIDLKSREVRFFGTKEGLPNAFIDPRQVIDVQSDRIATVCGNGLIVFDHDALWNSVTTSEEPVVIKQIRVSGQDLDTDQSVNYLSTLTLKPGQHLVDIEFQGLGYPNDYRMEYSYRINGLHADWISIAHNKLVTLPALGPGDYVFEVKTGNPQSIAPVKSLSIHVITPLHQRLWFIALMGLLATAIILGIVRWRIQLIRQQETAKSEINQKISELELKALRSQMNPHFMFNSLNSIKNYILHAEPKLAAEYLSNFSHLIRLILQNSREKSITLKEELETLVLYIDLEKLRFDDEFDFKYSVDEEIPLDRIRIPPMLLQPYVENAIWHGLMHKKERGHLELQFRMEQEKIACIIDDNGIGRTKAGHMKSLSATRYKSMGMGITKDRIEIMNKLDALGITADIIDKYDEHGDATGTRVVIRIPAVQEIYA